MPRRPNRNRCKFGLLPSLLLPIVLVILVAGSARTVLVGREEAGFARQRLEARAALLTVVLPPAIAELAGHGRWGELDETLHQLVQLPSGIAHLGWRLGSREAAAAAVEPPPAAPAWFAAAFDLAPVDLELPLAHEGAPVGVLRVRLAPGGEVDLAWRRVCAQAGTVLAVIALLLVAISLILRSSLAGLRALERSAARLSEGKSHVDVAPRGAVEIRTAARAFNAMAAAVSGELAARRQVEQALREQQATLASILEGLEEAVLVIDGGATVRLANPAARQLRERTDLAGQPLADLFPLLGVEERAGRDWPAFLAAVAAGGRQALGRMVLTAAGGPARVLVGSVAGLRGSGSDAFVLVLRDISETEKLLGEAEWQATHDALTGLPNRLLLADRLSQACMVADREQTRVAVCLFDLDAFKPVNDRFGHAMGDRLLGECARRVEGLLRGMDTVARLGGDEFVVILTGVTLRDQAEQVIERIQAGVSAPYQIDGETLVVSASLGYTLYPDDRADADTLLRHADKAMYAAKDSGRATWQRYDVDSRDETNALLAALEAALTRDELVLHYQPQVDLRTGRVLGHEALLRWQRPDQGLLLPGEFLPLAERTPLIEAIGDWVIGAALAQQAQWRAAGHAWTVAVNIAGRHFLKPDFVATLAQALGRYPMVPPSALVLEVTESSALADLAHAAHIVRECRALGVGVAVDDFGTGYASLAYLRQLPVDELKIDQHFVRDILDEKNDMALVEAVISLAAVFDRRVIAEGVETAEHGVLLMRLGCDMAQGYGIARPMPAAAVADWAATWIPDPAWALWADTSWELSDFPLLVAQYDHLRWVRRVLLFIDGASLQLAPREISDARQCRFGHWYYGHGQRHYGRLKEFAAIEPVHDDVHRLGQEIFDLVGQGNIVAARERSQGLLAHKDRILALLMALQVAVAHRR